LRVALSQALRGIVSQRLVRRADGNGRRPAIEVMVNTGRTAEVILDPMSGPPLLDLIKEGDFYKMQTFDQHLFHLVRDDVITYEEAMSASSNPHDLTVELRQAGLVS
jgi:twitching motility protein PilT